MKKISLRFIADRLHNRFNNATGGTVFSFIVIGVLYLFTKIPYLNLLFTPDINFGIFWIIYVYVYRVPVQITLILAGVFWILSLGFVIIGNNQSAELIVNNMYILLVTAVVQQIRDASQQPS